MCTCMSQYKRSKKIKEKWNMWIQSTYKWISEKVKKERFTDLKLQSGVVFTNDLKATVQNFWLFKVAVRVETVIKQKLLTHAQDV